MSDASQPRLTGIAVCIAFAMHLLLFLTAGPANGTGVSGAWIPPQTRYIPPAGLSPSGYDVRTIWSPVVFSMPSDMGFSRSLYAEKLYTRLTFRQAGSAESFLPVKPRLEASASTIESHQLMTSHGHASDPPLPAYAFSSEAMDASARRRVDMTPGLRDRLVGGIVLPPQLNRTGDAAWEVHADLTVSEDGEVRHVFLEKPLESVSLNDTIIRLLYGLHFKPDAQASDGRIEIYSPEAPSGGGGEP